LPLNSFFTVINDHKKGKTERDLETSRAVQLTH
jgi:hypothetical protein